MSFEAGSEVPPVDAGAPRLDLDRARTAGELLSASFEIYARYWRGFLLMALAVVGVLDLALYGVVGGLLWSDYDGSLSPYQIALVAIEPFLITVPLVTAVHVRAVQAIGQGRRPPVGRAIKLGVEDLPAVSLAVLLALVFVFTGLILFIVPGIYVAIRVAFAAQAVVVEGLRGFGAISRSWGLVDGLWWRTFGLLVLIGVIGGAASNIIATPFDALARGLDSGAVRVLAEIVGNTISFSFTALTSTLLFFDLRARKAGSRPRAGVPVGLEHPERVGPPT